MPVRINTRTRKREPLDIHWRRIINLQLESNPDDDIRTAAQKKEKKERIFGKLELHYHQDYIDISEILYLIKTFNISLTEYNLMSNYLKGKYLAYANISKIEEIIHAKHRDDEIVKSQNK